MYNSQYLIRVMVLRSRHYINAMHCGEAKMKNVMKFLKDKSGATAIEYGLIAALIAVAVIGGVTSLGTNANATFNNIADEMAAPAP
jgi:pilus assembly protein Flp/PilA